MTSGRGFSSTATAFVLWGAFPLFFHELRTVPPLQTIAHRIVWSCAFVLLWLLLRGELASLRTALRSPAVLARLALSATLITLNWVVYVWAVAHGHVVEGSLGYFIGPLVNVLFGVVLLSERLTRTQWTAVVLAAVGVAYLTYSTGRLPWIALTLAVSFSIYGLIRKVVKVEALAGLATETLLLFPLAAAFLLFCAHTGTGAFNHQGHYINVLLLGCGPITAVTLFLYAYGTRLIPYTTVGLLQYIAPTLQFACGVFVLHEPFDHAHVIGFALIWSALGIYALEELRLTRQQRTLA